jgi:N-acetyl-anhydromuramyl-L-alanine amidase AmpD
VIDTITIHCYVGQVTAKEGCDYFATTTRQASSNYVIGCDGSIGLSVEEKNRAWTSGGKDENGNIIRVNGISGADNDHRAVTIEMACDAYAPYAVTSAAYNALIALVADICKRNNIKKLLWKGDKSLVGQIGQQNMTVHRWFAPTACPGDYLYDRMGDIASKVNAKLTKKVEKGADMVKELVDRYGIEINNRDLATKALDKAKNNPDFLSLYWIIYKLLNGNR